MDDGMLQLNRRVQKLEEDFIKDRDKAVAIQTVSRLYHFWSVFSLYDLTM